MADNALQPAVVDVPIGSLNQTPPDHGGPTGRLTQLYDAIIKHYDAGGQKKVLLDPRQGFTSFTNAVRNSQSSGSEAGVWTDPTFLYALGDQLLSICSGIPRVWNGLDWTNYGDRRVITQKLSESVLHATNSTIAAPDHAYMAGTTCSVWTEQVFDSAGKLNTSIWVGFRADDGAWIRVPTKLRSAVGADFDFVAAKVVQDGGNFWVFFNSGSSEFPFITANVYDIKGVFLATTTAITRFWIAAPGYWDVLGVPAVGAYLVQPASYNAVPADVHVNVKKLTYAAGVITITNSALGSAHCMGPVQWLTNDLTDTRAYFATVGTSNHLRAYEINASLAQTHEYDLSETPTLLPDSVAGWVTEEGSPDGNRSVFVSYAQLAGPAASVGPTFDPATRFIKTVKCTFGGAVSTIRTTHSVIHQSRAFSIGGEYYAYTYYQSGSGQSLPLAPQSVSMTDGDYLIGSLEQPLSFTSGGTYGAPRPATLSGIFTGVVGFTGKFITGTDTVATFAADGSPGLLGIPIGTPVLKWTFANATPSSGHIGHILKVNASSIPTANVQWDIYGSPSSGVYYTPTTSRSGGAVVPGTFTATGTVDVIQMVQYVVNERDALFPPATMSLLIPNGTITVAGASNAGNNNTFTLVQRDSLLAILDINAGYISPKGSLWAAMTTQVAEAPTSGTATLTPPFPYDWFFTGEHFTDADLLGFLSVTDNPITENNAEHLDVTSIPVEGGSSFIVDSTEAAATVAQFFATPFPAASLHLKDSSTQYNLSLATITFDYTYQNALVSIVGAHHPSTNGIYKITGIISAHVARVERTDGQTVTRSETFVSDLTFPTISIQRATNVQPQTQPVWFVTPLTGSQPQVGCFEKGLAFADWRFDGELDVSPDLGPQNRYRFALSSTSNPFGTIRQVVLPFRVTSFTQVSIATVGATPIDIANTAEASTIGLKIFRSQGTGQGTGDAGKLLVPGLLAAEFTPSGFAENNVNCGPEAPFIVSEGVDAGAFALTPGATYTVQVVAARTLESGDVVRSLASPPIEVPLTGSNNFAVYGGRLLSPLNSDGTPTGNVYGVTNHASITYEIYRSVVVNGVPSTQLHLITNPGNPNGLYSGSGTGSGFSFPDTFTWNYRDENPDAGIRATEVIYAGTLGQGIAPHFPCPPFSHATTWANRRWVVGYDGAVWMSAEIQEGEDTWFFPGFRYPFPAEDPAVCVVGFENFLFMFCAKSIWRIGLQELPNATLTSGAMPPPVKLPWAMGCSGFAVATSDFVAYSSSVDGGEQVWAITRNLANVYLSEPIQDEFPGGVTSLAVDGKQRLLLTQGGTGTKMLVYDPVPREWYAWRLPSTITLLTSYLGQPTYQDSGFVLQQQDNQFVDTRNAVTSTIAIDFTLSSLTFAAVRAVKRLWEAQIIGEGHGDCNINAVISYPYSFGGPPTTFGPTRIPGVGDVLLAINPAIEDAGEFAIRIFGSYEGISVPGRCFSIEMLSCEVGLDSRQGIKKLPNGFRIVGG